MEWARDLLTNNDVCATDPTVSSRKSYYCPVCNASVFPRKGKVNAHHFAHQHGEGNSECELYSPQYYSKYQAPRGLVPRERSYRALGLYVMVIDDKKPSLSWHLEVGIPEPDLEEGHLKVPFSWNGLQTIPVRSIVSGGKRVRIQPQIQDYIIQAVQIPDSKWSKRIEQPIPGLEQKNITVFRYSSFGGRRLQESRPIYWGRSYVLLWSERHPPSWIPDNKLNIVNLRPVKGWSGAVVQLPIERNLEVERWVELTLSREVEHPPAEIRLVSPPPETRLDDGSLVVSNDEEIIIGITGESGARRWTTIYATIPELDRSHKFEGNGSIPALFSLGRLNVGRIDIWLDDDFDGGLQLVSKSRIMPPQLFRGIEMFAYIPSQNTELSVSLHSYEMLDLLEKVRKGDANILSVSIPDRVALTLYWKLSDQEGWDSRRFCASDEDVDVGEHFVKLLSDLLFHPEVMLKVDAGELGRFELYPRKNVIVQPSISMSKEWRNKAIWLIAQGKRGHGMVGKGEFTSNLQRFDVAKKLMEPTDINLLEQLSAFYTYPKALETHYRAVINEYNRIISGYLSCS